jgi:hypothetical protein
MTSTYAGMVAVPLPMDEASFSPPEAATAADDAWRDVLENDDDDDDDDRVVAELATKALVVVDTEEVQTSTTSVHSESIHFFIIIMLACCLYCTVYYNAYSRVCGNNNGRVALESSFV